MTLTVEALEIHRLFEYIVDWGFYTFLTDSFGDFVEHVDDIWIHTKYIRFAPKMRLPILSFYRSETDIEQYDYSAADFIPFPMTYVPSGTGISTIQVSLAPPDDEVIFNKLTVIERLLGHNAIYNKGFPLPSEVTNCRFVWRKLRYDILYVTSVQSPDNKFGLNRFIYRLSSLLKATHPQQWLVKEVPYHDNQVLKLNNYIMYIFLANISDADRHIKGRGEKEYPIYSVKASFEIAAPFFYIGQLQILDRGWIIQRNWKD